MDIEIVLNNHKSIHIEGGIQLSVLTQNTLFYGKLIMIPEERLHEHTAEIKRC